MPLIGLCTWQARSTMQLAMKLRAEGKEQDAVLMEKMALDLDPEAAAQVITCATCAPRE